MTDLDECTCNGFNGSKTRPMTNDGRCGQCMKGIHTAASIFRCQGMAHYFEGYMNDSDRCQCGVKTVAEMFHPNK